MVGYLGLAPQRSCPLRCRAPSAPDSRPIQFHALLPGQLATDIVWAGRGIGIALVKRALERCVTAAGLVGGRALMVNAVDKEAAAFWPRRGFAPSRDQPLILFRSIAATAASLEQARGSALAMYEEGGIIPIITL